MITKIGIAFKQKNFLLRACIVSTILLVGLVYIDGISVLVVQWMRLDELWRFFIVPVSLFFIWNQRAVLSKLQLVPSLFSGALLIGIGSVAYVLWKLSFVDLCIEISLFFLTIGLISLLLGNECTKIILLPLGYLVLMTSFIERILSPITVAMQYISAMITAFFLNIFGLEVLRDGRFLRLPHIVLEVATECSGTGQLTALIAFAIPLGILMHKSTMPRLLLLAATIPLTLLVNVIRIILIAIWNYDGIKSAIHGPHEILRMPFIYPLALILLYLLSMLFEKSKQKVDSPTLQSAALKKDRYSQVSRNVAWCYVFIFMIATVSIAHFYKAMPANYLHAIDEFPFHVDSWNGEKYSDSSITFYMGNPEAMLQRRFSNSDGGRVNLFIARFESQNVRKRILSVESDRFENEMKPINITVDSANTIQAQLTEMIKSNKSVAAVSWFDIDGKAYIDKQKIRKMLIVNTLRMKRNNISFISISTDSYGSPGPLKLLSSAATVLYPSIKSILKTKSNACDL